MTPEPSTGRAGAGTFTGLFLITLATLTYQLLLTRIFSVTMYYHFAFVAISVTMFGMAVGALLVYGRPAVFTPDRLPERLAQAALGFAIAIVASFLAHLWLPFRPELSVTGVATVVVTYAVLVDPFHLQRHRCRACAHAISAAGQRAVCGRSGGRGGRMRAARPAAAGDGRADGDRGDGGGGGVGAALFFR